MSGPEFRLKKNFEPKQIRLKNVGEAEKRPKASSKNQGRTGVATIRQHQNFITNQFREKSKNSDDDSKEIRANFCAQNHRLTRRLGIFSGLVQSEAIIRNFSKETRKRVQNDVNRLVTDLKEDQHCHLPIIGNFHQEANSFQTLQTITKSQPKPIFQPEASTSKTFHSKALLAGSKFSPWSSSDRSEEKDFHQPELPLEPPIKEICDRILQNLNPTIIQSEQSAFKSTVAYLWNRLRANHPEVANFKIMEADAHNLSNESMAGLSSVLAEKKFAKKSEILEPIDAFVVDTAFITSPILRLNMGENSTAFDDSGVQFAFEEYSAAESEGCVLDLFDNFGRTDGTKDDFLSESIRVVASPKRDNDYFQLYSRNYRPPSSFNPSESFGMFANSQDFPSDATEQKFSEFNYDDRGLTTDERGLVPNNSIKTTSLESPGPDYVSTYAQLAPINPYADPSPVRNFTYQKRRMF